MEKHLKASAQSRRRLFFRIAVSDTIATLREDKLSQLIILALLSINLLFISIHLLIGLFIYLDLGREVVKGLSYANFALGEEGAYPEIFNYIQAAACLLLLIGVFVRTRQPVYVAWAVVFAFVLMDDAFSIHERMGSYLEQRVPLPAVPGLRLQDSGELLVWSAAGAVLLPILIWGFRNSNSRAVGFGGIFAVIFASLVFFGMGVDMLHIAFEGASAVTDRVFEAVEDGGEMLSIFLALATALLLYRRLMIGPDEADHAL